jgi:hypothetical protein
MPLAPFNPGVFHFTKVFRDTSYSRFFVHVFPVLRFFTPYCKFLAISLFLMQLPWRDQILRATGVGEIQCGGQAG